MLSFSGWDFFGNMSVTLNFQGCGIVMNMFYGTVINAAYGIANTVQGTLKGLSVNVISASRPQIIKQYAMGDIPQMGRLVTNASKIALVLYLCMALPLYLEADFVIRLWLGIVPEYTVFLLKVILISTLFNVANNVLNIPIHATGRMKYFSFATGSFYILVPIILYFLLHVGVSVYHAFYVVVFTNMTTLLITILFVRFLVPGLGLRMLILYGYLPLLPLIIIYEIVCDFFLTNHGDWSRLLLSVLFSILLVGVFAAFYCLNKDQRLRFVCGAKQRLHL